MGDENWDDDPPVQSAPITNNNIGFGIGRGFISAQNHNYESGDGNNDRRPGFDSNDNQRNSGGVSKGFGEGLKGFKDDGGSFQRGFHGNSRGFSDADGQQRGFGNGGQQRTLGNGSSDQNNGSCGDDNGPSRDFGRGGRGFGDDNNDSSRGFGGGGRGFGDDNNDSSRGFGGRGSGQGFGRGGGGRGGGRNFNNDNDQGDASDGGSRGFGGGSRGGRGFGSRGGGSRGFGDDNEGGGGERNGRGFGENRGFNSGNDEDSGGSRGFGDGGGSRGDGFRGRGRGGGGRGGGRSFGNDNGNEDGGGRRFGNDRSTGGSRGFGGGDGEDGDGGSGFRGGRGGGRGRSNFGSDRENGEGGRFGNDRDGGGEGEDNDPNKPKKVVYVPPERPEVDALFNCGVKAGINFDKFDKIEVKTSGENVPEPIHNFTDANLRSLIMENIKKSGYEKPTPVQKHALPILLQGRDLMACAQTGSGKTAAFMIPIIHKLMATGRDLDMASANSVEPRALVLEPTRELAIQVHDEARKFSKGSILKNQLIYGGVQCSHSMRNLFSGCDILVATTGRLLDVVGRGKITFNAIEFIVLDEADMMLERGFLKDVEQILNHDTMPPTSERQTLLFSATFPEEIQQLAGKYMNNYVFLTVGIVGAASTDVEQTFVEVTKKSKIRKLKEILEKESEQNTLHGILVFVKEKRSADYVASLLAQEGFPATSIHGNREQKEREEALTDFRTGRMKVLVATAVGARGLDIPCVRFVINYDLPSQIDEYVHKIGRTGRVGNKGKAISFYDPEHDDRMKDLLVEKIIQANQEVPDWLANGSSSGDYGSASNFGAQDIRSFSDVQDGSQGAAQAVDKEDEW